MPVEGGFIVTAIFIILLGLVLAGFLCYLCSNLCSNREKRLTRNHSTSSSGGTTANNSSIPISDIKPLMSEQSDSLSAAKQPTVANKQQFTNGVINGGGQKIEIIKVSLLKDAN